MMGVVHVAMFVFKCLVRVRVLVILGKMQPKPDTHQQRYTCKPP